MKIFAAFLMILALFQLQTHQSKISGQNQANNQQFTFSPELVEPSRLTLGEYPQGKNAGLSFITWRILYREDNIALIVCEDILAYRKIQYPETGLWEDSELYKFLNDDFYVNAFSVDEKLNIIQSESGYIFLLSEEEARDYTFKTNKDRKARQTYYAFMQKSDLINAWWLMPQTNLDETVLPFVMANGSISHTNEDLLYGVRPACFVDLYANPTFIDKRPFDYDLVQ